MSDLEAGIPARSHDYQAASILLSMGAVAWYYVRTRKHAGSGKFSQFACAACLLALWNILQTVLGDRLLFLVNTMVRYKKALEANGDSMPWTHSGAVHDDVVRSKVNYFCLLKDLRMTAVWAVSVGCFYFFTRMGVQYLRSHAQEYSDKEDQEYEHQLAKTDRIRKRTLVLLLVLVLAAATQLVPDGALLSTASILYKSDWLVVRYDHVYFTMCAMFVLANCRTILRWSRRRPNFFYKGTLMVPLGFVWGYCSFILFVSVLAVVLFNDTLVSICTLKLLTAENGQNFLAVLQQHQYKVSSFSVFVLTYMVHAMGHEDTFGADFAVIRDIFENSWVVLNTAYLVVLPWILFAILDHRGMREKLREEEI